MLKANRSDSFPGAAAVAADPILSGECCAYSTMAELASVLAAAGTPYMFRAGKLWINGSLAELATVCEGALPVPATFESEPITDGEPNFCDGTLFGSVSSSFWLTNNATWGSETVKVAQFVTGWSATRVDFDGVIGALPQDPASVWAWVETACGAVNAVGLETTIQKGA